MEEAQRRGAGGIQSLVRLLSKHQDEVEADLRSEYGVRLSDLVATDGDGRPRLTWRELAVYVRQLPPGARTHLAQGDSDGLWTLGDHLTALAVDELRVANWQRQNEGQKASKQSKPPRPIERPGMKRRPDKNSPERIAKRQAAKARAAQRRADITAGRIT